MSGDYIMKKLKESLILSFEDWMKKMGNIDYSIKNIEFFQYNGVQYAKAYISYTQYLHGWAPVEVISKFVIGKYNFNWITNRYFSKNNTSRLIESMDIPCSL